MASPLDTQETIAPLGRPPEAAPPSEAQSLETILPASVPSPPPSSVLETIAPAPPVAPSTALSAQSLVLETVLPPAVGPRQHAAPPSTQAQPDEFPDTEQVRGPARPAGRPE